MRQKGRQDQSDHEAMIKSWVIIQRMVESHRRFYSVGVGKCGETPLDMF